MAEVRIGIDPGCSGAVVVLNGHAPIEWAVMPTMPVGKSTRVNGAELAAILRSWPDAHAYVEFVGAMPGQGVASMFSFGHAAGVAMGVLAALGIPHTLVAPPRWKKAAGLIGTEKDAARGRAMTYSWRACGREFFSNLIRVPRDAFAARRLSLR